MGKMLDNQLTLISIHPPREGWDRLVWPWNCRRDIFQSTHPVRGGTREKRARWYSIYHFNPPTP